MRLRKLVVFDRLMARLVVVAPNRWVVKGAALLFRLGARSRTTKNLDLGRQDNEEAATADFLAAQSLDLGDYFTFVIERTGKLDAMLEGVTVRYHVVAELGGRVFEDVTVDVGFEDRVVADPELVRGPNLKAAICSAASARRAWTKPSQHESLTTAASSPFATS